MEKEFNIFAVAEAVADALNGSGILPEGIAATADPVPEYELYEVEELKVPVSPAHVYLEDQSRSERRHRLIVQIGFIKHISGKPEIPVLVNLLQRVAGWFRHEEFTAADIECHVVDTECDPLYTPDEIREKNLFTGIANLEIEAYECFSGAE